MLHMIGIGDAYARDGKSPSKEGADSRTIKKGGDKLKTHDYKYKNPSVMLLSHPSQDGRNPIGQIRDTEATKVVASLITDNYQEYKGYADSKKGIGRTKDSHDVDGFDSTGIAQACKVDYSITNKTMYWANDNRETVVTK